MSDKVVVMNGQDYAIEMLVNLKCHFENTLTQDETDRSDYEKTIKALEWAINQ